MINYLFFCFLFPFLHILSDINARDRRETKTKKRHSVSFLPLFFLWLFFFPFLFLFLAKYLLFDVYYYYY